MILNKSQAEAVYTAMCYLNNVSGKIAVSFAGNIEVSEYLGKIYVSKISKTPFENKEEIYENQNAFREAYGIPE